MIAQLLEVAVDGLDLVSRFLYCVLENVDVVWWGHQDF